MIDILFQKKKKKIMLIVQTYKESLTCFGCGKRQRFFNANTVSL